MRQAVSAAKKGGGGTGDGGTVAEHPRDGTARSPRTEASIASSLGGFAGTGSG